MNQVKQLLSSKTKGVQKQKKFLNRQNDLVNPHPIKVINPYITKLQKIFIVLILATLFLIVFTPLAHASSGGTDPIDMLEKLKEYMFKIIALIGLILIGYGVLQIGLSFKSQDPSQRSTGIMTGAGGILIAGIGIIVDTISG